MNHLNIKKNFKKNGFFIIKKLFKKNELIKVKKN